MSYFKIAFISIAALFSSNVFAAKETINRCNADVDCVKLAEALYFEARGESQKGIIAVGQVIVNRTERDGFQDTVAGVVEDKRYDEDKDKWYCQFSYVCKWMNSGKAPKMNTAQSNKMKIIARGVLDGTYPDYSNGADHFVAATIKTPAWAKRMAAVADIGGHVFYDSTKSAKYRQLASKQL
jgi:spore germination cell wall hydrolase CwlJ-like protein